MVPEQVYRGWEAARNVTRESTTSETAEVLRIRVRVAQERLDESIVALRRVLAVT